MSVIHPQIKQQMKNGQFDIIFQQKKLKNSFDKNNSLQQQSNHLVSLENSLLHTPNLNRMQIEKDCQNKYNNQLFKLNEFQMLRLNLKQWRERRAPNMDEIISVCYVVAKPQVKNIRNSVQKYIIKQAEIKKQYDRQNSVTNDFGNQKQLESKVQVIKKLKITQKMPIKKEKTHINTKFRQSTNSHLRKEKKLQQEMWACVIQQKFFYDNCKYRYESEQIIQSIEEAANTCIKFKQYKFQTVEVPQEPQFSRTRSPNQFQEALNLRISKLYPRSFNLKAIFF